MSQENVEMVATLVCGVQPRRLGGHVRQTSRRTSSTSPQGAIPGVGGALWRD